MKIVLFLILGVVALVILVPFGLRAAQSHRGGAAAVGLALPVASTTASTANLTSGMVELRGTAILDESSGLPAVPYISYTDANGRTRTKQLIYVDERGCLPNAGDVPCVPTHPESSAYPKISTGQRISVKGYVRDDRFLVSDISVDG